MEAKCNGPNVVWGLRDGYEVAVGNGGSVVAGFILGYLVAVFGIGAKVDLDMELLNIMVLMLLLAKMMDNY